MKTEALKQALDKHGFDAAFGGARRDEEKSRAKERDLLVPRRRSTAGTRRTSGPSSGTSTTRARSRGESIRVFPLSNWTELDVWHYIYLEQIPIVPLYFAQERPVVERDGTLIMVDDDRMPLEPGEEPRAAAGPLPHARLLPAHRRDRERRRRRCPEIIEEMLLARDVRAPGARHRPRRSRLDGEEEARGLLLMPRIEPRLATTSTPTSTRTSTRACCASSRAAASTTARAR